MAQHHRYAPPHTFATVSISIRVKQHSRRAGRDFALVLRSPRGQVSPPGRAPAIAAATSRRAIILFVCIFYNYLITYTSVLFSLGLLY